MIGSFVMATSESYDAFMFSSTNGINWTTNLVGNFDTSIYPFDYFNFMVGNGNVIALGYGGQSYTEFLQFFTNDVIWTNIYEGIGGETGAYGNGTFVVVPALSTSPDGFTWTNQQQSPAPPTGPTNNLTSICFSNGVYVVAEADGVVISTNDLAYATVSNSPALSAIIAGSNGFTGVGGGGTIYVSSDGISWTQRNSGTASNLYGITSGGGLLVAVGDDGAIQTSPTGTIWTSRDSGSSLPLYAATYSNGLFVVVGQEGTVLTSPDGINWTVQYSGVLTNLLSVTYGSAGFAAVGSGGTILISADGINWTSQNSGTAATLESICYGNGYYLAAGDGAVVLTSPDGINWTSRNIGVTGGQNLYGAAFINNRFDVVGSGGTILESDVIAPLFDLQIH
ncbi:MAG: hypothetical protein ABR955_14745, partial [Verrucomicrobiota bacterium]